MKKRCDKCERLFEVEANLAGNVKIGKVHKEKLCEKCWKEIRCYKNQKGDKKFGRRGNDGGGWMNLNSNLIGSHSKQARKMILIRNNKITKLNEIIDRLSKENIKLKEELLIRGIKY